MSIFESIRTVFKLVVANLTQEVLCYLGIGFLFAMIVWSVLSLIFNKQIKFRKNAIDIIKYLRNNNLSAENYKKFISLWSGFPAGMKRCWKRYETKREGIPSDYLNIQECYELPLVGGITKQNRSLMRTIIYFFIGMLSIVSIATIGLVSASSSTNAIITTSILTDAMLVPLVVYLLCIVVYYIYTLIRHYEHISCVETFYDLVDMLDQRADISSIFGGDLDSIGLVSDIYKNETLYLLKEEYDNKLRNNSVVEEIKLGSSGLNPAKAGVLGKTKKEKVINKNVIKTTIEPKLLSETIKTPELEIKENQFVILNEKQFISTVDRVEYLIEKAKREKNKQMRIEIEKEINRLLKALTDFKQKAKSKKKKV